MTVRKSTKTTLPRKPYPSFPLRPHGNGQWCKTVAGRVRFYGTWDDPKGALEKYNRLRAYHETGTDPEAQPEGLTVKQAINAFLARLEAKAGSGERTHRHFLDCQSTAKVIVSVIDRSRLVESLKGEDFFKLRRRFGTKQDGKPASPATINGHIRRTVAIFNFAVKEGLVDRVVYGADFKGFTEKQKTDLQQRAADKVLNREAVRQLLAAANYRFRAMLLLGINCGMGNTDVANLRIEDLELEGGWYESRRSKTSVRRCSKLWPETVDALRVVLARRFKHRDKSDAGLVFITRYGRSYRDQAAITHEFQSVKEASKIKTPKGAGFYSLRHTLRTVAGRWADETAIRWIMGHKRSRIDDHYIHAPPKDRIAELSEKVRTWLFSGEVVR